MTPEDHNKTLGICHLVYGGLMLLLMFAMFIFMWMMFSEIPSRPGRPDAEMPAAFLAIFFAFMFVYSLIFFVPSLVAGYAMLKRKTWARMASIIASVFEVMSFPLGTAVGIYSFWFMFSETGKSLYGGSSVAPAGVRPYALHDAPPQPASDWNAQTSFGREREYTPPTQPPAWRDE
ncbi:MAG TPA: hypothetical protein VGB76_09500 [Pyrinomonadaceae bacterium]|jgi:hypothetical protein